MAVLGLGSRLGPGPRSSSVGGPRQTLQPDGRQFRPDVSAHGRQGHLYPDTLGDRGAKTLGRRRQAAQKSQGSRRAPVLFQRLGSGNRPAVLPAQPDPRRFYRRLSRMTKTTAVSYAMAPRPAESGK